ncbi:MAG TPA: IDEAL domain-containing protein [Virgibacillus sp.]|nr:IDEAL domain-containing protein [Virgibacillus sp.]
MVTIKLLKPYYIKTDDEMVRVILAYQYFTMVINSEIYQFVPLDAKEVHVNRKTQKIENIDALFAFQKGKEIIHIPMSELVMLPDFLDQVLSIAEPYFEQEQMDDEHQKIKEYNEKVIKDLEKMNIKRLIDRALDEKDEETFKTLAKLLW